MASKKQVKKTSLDLGIIEEQPVVEQPPTPPDLAYSFGSRAPDESASAPVLAPAHRVDVLPTVKPLTMTVDPFQPQ